MPTGTGLRVRGFGVGGEAGEPGGGAWGARPTRGGAPAAAGSAVRTAGATVAAVPFTVVAPRPCGESRGRLDRSDLARGWPRLSLPRCGLDGRGRGEMEPSPATGGSETTRLVSPRDGGGAGGGLRLKR